jgi:putative tributyrin esterase
MGCMNISFWGKAIKKQSQMSVCFPDRLEGGNGPLPVLILLHGLSDDNTAWMRWSNIERHAAQMPLLVVMPDGARSFYTDAADGPAYEQHIMSDVIGTVERFFNVRRDGKGRCVSGLSMGGYGAIKLALKYPDRFASATGLSGAYGICTDEIRHGGADLTPELLRIFGPNRGADGPDDPFALAERADPANLPALRIDCGTEDRLVDVNRRYHAHLDRLAIAHEYAEYPGAHTWDYWEAHIQESLAFHARHLGI